MQNFFHQPISIHDLTISFARKECITQPFNYNITYGEKIGIIGRNGSGKTSLLNALNSVNTSYEGTIYLPHDVVCSYIPQLIVDDSTQLSGGQRFLHKLSSALATQPNLLLLDEPTNHLDQHNRQALFGFLTRYSGTLITVTHDVELLACVDTLWHIFNGKVSVFNGSYNEFMRQQQHEWHSLTQSVKEAQQQKNLAHQQLIHEQKRAKTSKEQGEKHIRQRKWPTITSGAKARRAETTSGKNSQRIELNRQQAIEQLQQLYVPEIIVPKFNLDGQKTSTNKIILKIENGALNYAGSEQHILSNINLLLTANEKITIQGNNGSGKSTLLKAIRHEQNVIRSGEWLCPNNEHIGYVDQHYSNLNTQATASELLQQLVPSWSYGEVRNHLNSFLLRKNEEVNLASKYLSGGEKARLSLALIAAKPPQLLILDEITNNIDLETKEHLCQILANYPSSMILVCHEQNFIEQLKIDRHYKIKNGTMDYLL